VSECRWRGYRNAVAIALTFTSVPNKQLQFFFFKSVHEGQISTKKGKQQLLADAHQHSVDGVWEFPRYSQDVLPNEANFLGYSQDVLREVKMSCDGLNKFSQGRQIS
jgi:hypothetical protein